MRRALCLSIGLGFGACAPPSADELAGGAVDGGTSSSSSGAPSEAGPNGTSDGGHDADLTTFDSGSDSGGVNLMKDPDFE